MPYEEVSCLPFTYSQVSRMDADGARLKCNREKPCQNCTARDERSTCNYKGSKNGSTPSAHQEDHGVDLMQQRIDHLEGLVKKLIAQRPDSSPSSRVYTQDSPGSLTGPVTTASSLDASDVACSTGTTVIDGSQSVYKGADDWYDVLQEVSLLPSILRAFHFSFCAFLFAFLARNLTSHGDFD